MLRAEHFYALEDVFTPREWAGVPSDVKRNPSFKQNKKLKTSILQLSGIVD
jgi:hypothetical protein